MVNASTHTVRDQELENETLRSKKLVGYSEIEQIISAELKSLGGKTVNWFQA